MRVLSPTPASQLEGWHQEEHPLALKASGVWVQTLWRTAETETSLLEGTHKVSHALGLRAKQWLLGNCARPTGVLEDLLRRRRMAVAQTTGRDKDVGGRAPGNIHQHELSQRLPFWWPEVKVTQSCPTVCDPVDYTVHGILQARILE